MLKPQRRDGMGDMLGLGRVERARQPRLHIAKGAGARAGVAHDHHGRVLLLPALADVGAAGLLAHGVQAVLAHDLGRAGIARPSPAPLRESRQVCAAPAYRAGRPFRDGAARRLRVCREELPSALAICWVLCKHIVLAPICKEISLTLKPGGTP